MKRLRLLSFNIHGGRARDGSRDLSRVHTLMEKFDIDVGVFQEMETRSSRGGSGADLDLLAGISRPHRLLGPNMRGNDGWYGNLIVSRYPFLRGLYHNLQTRKHYEPRSAIDAFIESPLGPVRIIGTHLSLSPNERRNEIKRLIELITLTEQTQKEPTLLMGDINEWQRPSRLTRFLNKHMHPVHCGNTFPSWLPIFALDRVWEKAPGFHVAAHRIADRQTRLLSDHLPILAEIYASL